MSDTVENPETVDSALQQFREMLASDGYLLNWSALDNDRVVVEIEAGEDACADCLAPKPVVEVIMAAALASTPYTLDHVVLPTGSH